jgi:hypothetical protein
MKINEAVQVLGKTSVLGAETVVPVLAFAIPLLVSGPQWLTGSLVNCFLYLSVTRLSERTLWMVIVLPSIGALAHGALFGKFTLFLAFFLPFIWVGNFLLVRFYTLFLGSWPAPLAVVFSSFIKAVLLYVTALIYLRLNLVPQQFLVAMGFVQFYTAVMGGFLAMAILRFI